MTDATTPERPVPTRRRRWLVAAVALVAVLAVAVAVAVGRGGSGGATADPGASPSAAPTADPTTPAASPSAPPAADPGAGGAPAADPAAPADPAAEVPVPTTPQPELPPAAPDATVAADLGLSVRLASVESVQGQAAVAGEVAGPAVRLTVEVTNGGTAPVDLAYSLVNAYEGEDRTPLGQLTQPDGRPLQGVLAPGASATGVYLFVVPPDERGDVTVVYDYAAGSPSVVFRGAVG